MAIDPTVQEYNYKYSVIEHFYSNRDLIKFDGQQVPVEFDKDITTVPLLADNTEAKTWITVRFGPMTFASVSEAELTVFCCTREDPEGRRLSQLKDKMLGLFFDPSQPTGRVLVPFYDFSDPQNWSVVSNLVPYINFQTEEIIADDHTKYRNVVLMFRWGARI